MPLFFDYQAHQGGGAGGAGGDAGAGSPMTGTHELAGGGFSASLQDRLFPRPEMLNSAHQFFQPQIDAGLLPNTVIGTGAESAMLQPMNGMETVGLKAVPAAEAAGMNAIAGAKEAISPVIQMIMRLPGALGVAGSFFEALAAFFNPANWLNAFQWLHFGHHAQLAVFSMSTLASEHLPISLALLPSNAPIFQTLGHGALAQGAHTFGLSSARLGGSLGEHGLFSPNALHISGKLDLAKPQFEGTGSGLGGQGLELSGPHMSNNLGSGHLAGNSRLFSDKVTALKGSNLSQLSQSAQTPATLGASGVSQTVSLTGQSVPHSLNVGANAFGQGVERLPAVARLGDGQLSGPTLSNQIGHHLGSPGSARLDTGYQFGPSGAVGDRLGGNNLLASSAKTSYSGSPFAVRPEAAPVESQLSQSSSLVKPQPSQPQASPAAAQSAQAPAQGLKAKQLSLDSAPARTSQATDHVGYQSKGGATGQGHATDRISHRAPRKTEYADSSQPGHKVSESRPQSAGESKSSYSRFGESADQVASPAGDSTDAVAGQSAGDSSTYTIQPGDNLWNIARQQMGSGYKWQEIYGMNKDVLGANPDLIHPGTEIQLPGSPSEIASSSTTYTVAPGDNLWNIARDHLGGGKYWNELYSQNAEVIGNNPDLIFPGQQFNMPGQADLGNVAAQPAVDPQTISPSAVDPQSMTQAPKVSAEPQTSGYTDGTAPAQSTEISSLPSYAHPVFPSWKLDPPVQLSPGAVQAAGAAGSASPVVTKSLQPDLSFLKKKR